jgi:hypothetical protein
MQYDTSGYCDCACRDCFEIAISSVGDIVGTVLCYECKEAGCEAQDSDCQREDIGYDGSEI